MKRSIIFDILLPFVLFYKRIGRLPLAKQIGQFGIGIIDLNVHCLPKCELFFQHLKIPISCGERL